MDESECKAEQNDEIEALQSIYEDDFNILSNDPPKFTIRIAPHNSGEEVNHVILVLEVEYPLLYPEVAPKLAYTSEKGLVKKQIEKLKQIANEQIEENLGMVSIFTIAEALKEWLLDNNQPQQSLYEQIDDKIKKNENDENKETGSTSKNSNNNYYEEEKKVYSGLVPAGTITTLESFADWKTKFDEEMAKKQPVIKETKEQASRLTGRQIFQQKLNAVNKPKDSETTDKTDDVFWFNEAAYDAYDDDDLPSDDDDDDDDDDDEEEDENGN